MATDDGGEVTEIFISHVAEEADLAQVLEKWIERAVEGDRAFVFSSDIELGEQWLAELQRAISRARAIVVLCSPSSVERPWVNFEAGGGWASERPVVPLCHSGMSQQDLPYPLSVFQATELPGEVACRDLVRRVTVLLEMPVPTGFDYAGMTRDVEEAIERMRRANPTSVEALSPPRGGRRGILVDTSHRQDSWRAGSIFDLPDGRLVSRVAPDRVDAWDIRSVSDARQFWAPDLEPWGGLILGSPHACDIDDVVREQIVSWVRAGGRLLLLGYELGDRHHLANLNTVAHEFGLHLNCDIVSPPDFPEGKKPYGVGVSLVPAADADHPSTQGVGRLELANVQTLSVDPGSRELVRLGDNRISRPGRDSVLYEGGHMSTPAESYQAIEGSGWATVIAEAPRGLTGRGGVMAMGTWDLLGPDWRYLDTADNAALLSNILGWLAHES